MRAAIEKIFLPAAVPRQLGITTRFLKLPTSMPLPRPRAEQSLTSDAGTNDSPPSALVRIFAVISFTFAGGGEAFIFEALTTGGEKVMRSGEVWENRRLAESTVP